MGWVSIPTTDVVADWIKQAFSCSVDANGFAFNISPTTPVTYGAAIDVPYISVALAALHLRKNPRKNVHVCHDDVTFACPSLELPPGAAKVPSGAEYMANRRVPSDDFTVAEIAITFEVGYCESFANAAGTVSRIDSRACCPFSVLPQFPAATTNNVLLYASKKSLKDLRK
jgi:hypothetical protein